MDTYSPVRPVIFTNGKDRHYCSTKYTDGNDNEYHSFICIVKSYHDPALVLYSKLELQHQCANSGIYPTCRDNIGLESIKLNTRCPREGARHMIMGHRTIIPNIQKCDSRKSEGEVAKGGSTTATDSPFDCFGKSPDI